MTSLLPLLLAAAIHAGAAASPPSDIPPTVDDVAPLLRSGAWDEAAEALERAVAANPYDALAFYYLGVCYERLDRCEDALPALERSLALGANAGRNGMRSAELAAARCAAGLGRSEESLDHLERAWRRWGLEDVGGVLEGEAFAALRDDPRALALAGRNPRADAGDRVARWRADLDRFRRLVRETHPRPFHSIDADAWRAAADSLAARIPEAGDLEICAGFLRLASLIGDGHTAVYPPVEGDLAWHLLPFHPIRLRDGWYVGAAAPSAAPAVGARILGAGGVPFAEIERVAARHLAHDNEHTADWLAGVALQFHEIYRLAGAAESGAPIELEVALADGGRRTVRLEPGPVDRNPNARWAPAGWPSIPLPLWLRHAREPFHHERIGDGSVVYAQVNQTADADTIGMAEYGRRLRTFCEGAPTRALVLDLRLNNGGDANDARGFVDELVRMEALESDHALLVLIGPRTFSATGYVLGFLERHLHPVKVGLPSGCRPVNYSSERGFRLPYSGLRGSISCELRVDGYGTDDVRPWFAPDFTVWPGGEDLRAGRDPVLAFALRLLH